MAGMRLQTHRHQQLLPSQYAAAGSAAALGGNVNELTLAIPWDLHPPRHRL